MLSADLLFAPDLSLNSKFTFEFPEKMEFFSFKVVIPEDGVLTLSSAMPSVSASNYVTEASVSIFDEFGNQLSFLYGNSNWNSLPSLEQAISAGNYFVSIFSGDYQNNLTDFSVSFSSESSPNPTIVEISTPVSSVLPTSVNTKQKASDNAHAYMLDGDLDLTFTADSRDNYIFGNSGYNTITGGVGNDVIQSGDGNDKIDGGDGDDKLYTGYGNSLIVGGKGNDTIEAGTGDNTIDGGDGNDVMQFYSGSNVIKGGKGNDVITVDYESLDFNKIDGGDGDDEIISGGGRANVLGGKGNDTITAGQSDDTINGGDGNDVIDAGYGRNSVNGGAGDDVITAYDGHNKIDGGDGNDSITVGVGRNNVKGGKGNDTINAGEGNDTIDGGANDDVINAGNGNNKVLGGAGSDSITSGFGSDSVDGGADNDTINGGAGNDTLLGGAGDDVLIAGDGFDVLTGGAGFDKFVLSLSSDLNTVKDFKSGEDKLVFTLSETPVELNAVNFVQSATSVFTFADDLPSFGYNTKTGALFYDADGTGVGEQVQIALIANKAALVASDILF